MREFCYILLLSLSGLLNAQDILLNQFMRCPTYTNPALTGTGKDTLGKPGARLASLYRNQWSLPSSNPYRTNFLGYDQKVSDGFGSIGGYFIYDAAGKDGAFQTTQFNMTYSFAIPISRGRVGSLYGLSVGYKNLNVNYAKLKFEDQIDVTRGVVRKTDEFNRSANDGNFDVNAGFVFYNKRGYLGASFHNIARPRIQFVDYREEILKPRFSLILGNKWYSMDSNDRGGSYVQLTGGFFAQADQMQLNMSGYYHWDGIALGAGYRGNKSLQYQSDALVLTCMLDVKNFNLYYGFEFTISKLSSVAPVSHEIGLQIPLSISPFYRERYRSNGFLQFPM